VNAAIVAALLIGLLALGYQAGWSRSRALAGSGRIHSRPHYHGALTALWALLPALAILAVWTLLGAGLTRAYAEGLLPPDLVAAGGAPLSEALASASPASPPPTSLRPAPRWRASSSSPS
jgi:phosphate transport system permease protein